MARSDCKQYAFKVDSEERAAFNRAVAAQGGSSVKEIRRMVEDFLNDRSRYGWIMNSPKAGQAQVFANKEVRINALFDEITLRRFSVTCQYASVTASYVLREMIIAYANGYASCQPELAAEAM